MTASTATAGDDQAAGAAEAAATATDADVHVQDGRAGQQASKPNDGDAGDDGAKHGQHGGGLPARGITVQNNGPIYCNVRGLWLKSTRPKVNYIRDTAKESKAPFIVLTETHLKPEILDAEVKMGGAFTGQTGGQARAMGGLQSTSETT